ncbi:MAG: hypothetical protein VB939_03390 [Pseudomonadales bacterium]
MNFQVMRRRLLRADELPAIFPRTVAQSRKAMVFDGREELGW